MNSLESLAVLTNDTFLPKLGQILTRRFEDKNYGYYYTIPFHYLDKLSLEQLKQLAEHCKFASNDNNYKYKRFEKTYHYNFQDPEYYECATYEEKRDLFIRISEECKREGQTLRTCLIRQILEYGIKLDTYDKKMFEEYLQYPISTSCLKYNGPSHAQGDNWSSFFYNLKLNPQFGDSSFYRKILWHFYNEGDDWKSFSNYFEGDWIRNLRIEYDFLSGKEIPESEAAHISVSTLTKQVLIEF